MDCKARSKRDYWLDAHEERKVKEYILNFPREYPNDRRTTIYYLIISSDFRSDNDVVRGRIKTQTGGTEVSFVRIEDLLFLLSKKLQNIDIDLDLIEPLFSRGGIITKDIIQDIIGR